MTRFALLIWAWEQAGDATTVALLGFFSYGPFVLVSPFAGFVVDRFDRRKVMVLSDLGAGLITGGLLTLLANETLQIWHLYLAQGLGSALEAFQFPAYTASITMLVPKSQYTRTSSMNSLSESASTVVAPILAGAVLALIKISGVMVIDIVTFLFAVTTLLLVRIPRPPQEVETDAIRPRRFSRLSLGFRYIFARKGLLGLLLIFAGINLIAALTYFAILPVLILARTGSDELALATVQGALGIGGVVGSIVVGVWGVPKRRIHGCLLGAAISFVLGDFLMGIGRSVPVWAVAAFLAAAFIPLISASQQVIWQSKVSPEVQGRVFAAKSMLQMATFPLGYLLAGPLADRLFEPAMASGKPVAEALGWLVGTGPGAGIGLMFVATSIMGMAMSLSGYLFDSIRNVERDLPDHSYAAAGGIGAYPSLLP